MNIAFDITHLVARTGIATPTGIDRVDTAFAEHLGARVEADLVGVQYGFGRPYLFPREEVARLAGQQTETWQRTAGNADSPERQLWDFIAAPSEGWGLSRLSAPSLQAREHRPIRSLIRHVSSHRENLSLPAGTVYLNVAQYLLEISWFTRWLQARPDIKPVFFIHDLIPLDYPEYFRNERKWRFPRILQGAMRHAAALIASSETTAERIARYRREMGLLPIPIIAEPLPAATPFLDRTGRKVSKHPYVVAIGTVEPRKNYLGLLHLWRRLLLNGQTVPKLVILGRIGWENEGVLALLERSPVLKGHVVVASGVSDDACLRLLHGARALVSPSFAEGYGIPVVEALSAGVPVIVSDIPVYREITQGLATFCAPLDGRAWGEAVTGLLHPGRNEALQLQADAFSPPSWERYFDRLLPALQKL